MVVLTPAVVALLLPGLRRLRQGASLEDRVRLSREIAELEASLAPRKSASDEVVLGKQARVDTESTAHGSNARTVAAFLLPGFRRLRQQAHGLEREQLSFEIETLERDLGLPQTQPDVNKCMVPSKVPPLSDVRSLPNLLSTPTGHTHPGLHAKFLKPIPQVQDVVDKFSGEEAAGDTQKYEALGNDAMSALPHDLEVSIAELLLPALRRLRHEVPLDIRQQYVEEIKRLEVFLDHRTPKSSAAVNHGLLRSHTHGGNFTSFSPVASSTNDDDSAKRIAALLLPGLRRMRQDAPVGERSQLSEEIRRLERELLSASHAGFRRSLSA
eukprot:TRINITY_DN54869_c0_g1_i1.p1 TRINITY_DN54869_c0_g1~~TRINITY_DN54869_c0_g1_i1.p1  ORF type:complete len:347 (+),score=43.64 TRINITY_DN54869_c0_g1_i1:66-1043(+)